MAKYIIDLDSFIECLDFIVDGKLNGHDYAFIQNVKAFVTKFPKCKVEESVSIKIENEVKTNP